MTDQPVDEGKTETDPIEPENNAEEEIIEDDPMITEMKEAEAEIEAQEKAKAEEEGEEDPESDEDKGKKEPDTEAEKDKGNMPTVPKARFDEVLSERDLLRNQVGYMRGLIDASDGKAKPESAEEEQKQDGSEVDEIDTLIDEAEAKKLELAEKYDEGEISTTDMKKQEIEIDREIRKLADQRETARIKEAQEANRSETSEALNAAQQRDYINESAAEIQKNHPNVEVIDATPEAIRDGIWNQISAQAAQNLAQRGIDITKDGSVNAKLEFIKEKAALTDQYTPETLAAFLPKGYTAPSTTQQQQEPGDTSGQKKPTEAAINRQKKLELAESQPPNIADMGSGTDTGELSEEQIANLSEDQIADMVEKNHPSLKRILGSTAT